MTDPNALAGIVFTHLDKLSKSTLSEARKARTGKLFLRELRAVVDPETGVLLGYEQRVGMTNRPTHDPTPESNEVIYLFFEHFLKREAPRKRGG